MAAPMADYVPEHRPSVPYCSMQFGGVGAIPLGEKLLGEYMRDAGYATHVSPVLSVNAAYSSWLLVHAIDVELGCAVVLTRSFCVPGNSHAVQHVGKWVRTQARASGSQLNSAAAAAPCVS